ncbi:hypothetical protein OsccyDRAFT_1106 [Leptolyngbyaceae cyanobacterium JSC-12]|nr:hypothetical protein OsccyDRAFT_1106 [Leptolyngbyaceae cyanobacterium JSC-12]
MLSQAPYPTSFEQAVDRILASRRITRADQQLLLSLQDLTAQQRAMVNRLFDRLRSGLLKVVD